MKKVMFALCFMFGGAVALMAQDQDTTSNQYRTETQSQYPQDEAQDPAMDQSQGMDQSGGLHQGHERIQSTELPEEVKTALEGEQFRGWLVSGAFKASSSSTESDTTATDPSQESNNAFGTEGDEIYIVELKNGADTRTVAFDKNGQEVELEAIEGQELNESNQYNQDGQMDQTAPEESTVPDQSTPDQSTPGYQTPESTTPESTTPESTTPESTIPESTIPESTTPESTTPETPEIPESSTPDESATDESTIDDQSTIDQSGQSESSEFDQSSQSTETQPDQSGAGDATQTERP